MIVDLHVHSEGGVRAMFARAKELGLDGLGFTDGPDFGAADEVHAAASEAGMAGFCGCQVATNRGVLLCFFPDLSAMKGDGWLEKGEGDKLPVAEKVVAAVEARGGVTIAAYPYFKDIPAPMGDHIYALKGLHACEAASPLAGGMKRDLAIEASETLQLPCVGGSAARAAEHVGVAATYLPDTAGNEAELCKLIRERRCWAVLSLNEVPRDAQPSTPGQPRPRGNEGRGGRGGRPHRGGGRPRGERGGGGDRGPGGGGGGDRGRDRGPRR